VEQEIDTSANGSFSREIPGLQVAVDSTSLGAYKTCPKLYYYSIVLGYQPKKISVHLTFGTFVHSTSEIYQHAKAAGADHQEALLAAIRWLLVATWNKELKRPWQSEDTSKNRLTLLRSMVWYLDTFGEKDPLQTVILADGKPAVELSFRFDSGYKYTSTEETVLFCGHLDRLAVLGDEYYIPDIKSTYYTIDASYFAKYTPDNQFSMYSLAGKVAFAMPVAGVILDAMQVQVQMTRFQRKLIPRTRAQLEEWTQDSYQVLREMEQSALSGHWRQNDKACHNQFGRPCDFREVCSRPAGARKQWLELAYNRRVWNPLERRGEV
jgi:hypothetical protein